MERIWLRPEVPRTAARPPLVLAWAAIESPLGVLLAAAGDRGLVCVAFDGERPESILRDLAKRLSADLDEAPDRFEEPRRQIHDFFRGRRERFDLPVDLASIAGPHRDALQSVTRVPYGHTVAYRRVTDALSGAQAGRVAGEALGANPLAIVVPCHRVLRADGGLGAYVGGLERKQALLELEGTRP